MEIYSSLLFVYKVIGEYLKRAIMFNGERSTSVKELSVADCLSLGDMQQPGSPPSDAARRVIVRRAQCGLETQALMRSFTSQNGWIITVASIRFGECFEFIMYPVHGSLARPIFSLNFLLQLPSFGITYRSFCGALESLHSSGASINVNKPCTLAL